MQPAKGNDQALHEHLNLRGAQVVALDKPQREKEPVVFPAPYRTFANGWRDGAV